LIGIEADFFCIPCPQPIHYKPQHAPARHPMDEDKLKWLQLPIPIQASLSVDQLCGTACHTVCGLQTSRWTRSKTN